MYSYLLNTIDLVVLVYSVSHVQFYLHYPIKSGFQRGDSMHNLCVGFELTITTALSSSS